MVQARSFAKTMPRDMLSKVDELCAAHRLAVLGGFHPTASDNAPKECQTLLMIGPASGFWEQFKTSDEFKDQQANPIDRWSSRVLGGIAKTLTAEPLFPFGGPPYVPFISWALRSEQCFVSPVELLVHAQHGLMVSFRGALAFGERFDVPSPSAPPCKTCISKPCLTACPAGVLNSQRYDVPGCHAYLRSTAGQSCKSQGCQVRRACPLHGAERNPEQSGFHMSAFQGE